MLGAVQDETKHIHLQWFGEEETAGAAAATNQPAGGTPEGKAGDSRGEASASGANGKGAEPVSKTVSAEEHAKVKAEYERILGIFKEKESKEKRQRDEALRKQGEFEKLYSETAKELESTKPKLERMSAIVQALLDAELQGLPTTFDATLMPQGDPDQKLEWLLKAKKAGLFAGAPAGTGAPARKPGDGTPPQRGAASEGFESIYNKRP
jgi:hypothetical protein